MKCAYFRVPPQDSPTPGAAAVRKIVVGPDTAAVLAVVFPAVVVVVAGGGDRRDAGGFVAPALALASGRSWLLLAPLSSGSATAGVLSPTLLYAIEA